MTKILTLQPSRKGPAFFTSSTAILSTTITCAMSPNNNHNWFKNLQYLNLKLETFFVKKSTNRDSVSSSRRTTRSRCCCRIYGLLNDTVVFRTRAYHWHIIYRRQWNWKIKTRKLVKSNYTFILVCLYWLFIIN